MSQPSEALVSAIRARLTAMGMHDAASQASVIAAIAVQLAHPELLARAHAAERAAAFVRSRTEAELAALPGLRYALAIYATGRDDGGALASRTLRSYRRRR